MSSKSRNAIFWKWKKNNAPHDHPKFIIISIHININQLKWILQMGPADEGRRPHLRRGSRRPPPLWVPLVLKALASAYFQSIATGFLNYIGHPDIIKAASHPLFWKLPCNPHWILKLGTSGPTDPPISRSAGLAKIWFGQKHNATQAFGRHAGRLIGWVRWVDDPPESS